MNDNQNQKFFLHTETIPAIILFFILLFVFAKWGPSINFSTTTQNVNQPFVVTGEGTATAVPDIAKIDFGVQDSGTSLTQVQNSVNKKSQTLVAALKKLGIADNDIKTTQYSINPTQNYNVTPPTITGYQITVSYEVTIRNLDNINGALTDITGAGANLVGGVIFDLSDDARIKAETAARTDAVKIAKENAQSLANASGITLGKIINVSEAQNSVRPVPFLQNAGLGAGVAEKSIAQPNIQPGSTEIDITVSLSYQIR